MQKFFCNSIELHHATTRAPDKVCILISIMPIFLPNPTFDHLLDSSHRDDSNNWSNSGFVQEIKQVKSTEFNLKHFIWSSEPPFQNPAICVYLEGPQKVLQHDDYKCTGVCCVQHSVYI